MNDDLLEIRLSKQCIWPADAPDEFVLNVPGSLAEDYPDEKVKELIRASGYTLVYYFHNEPQYRSVQWNGCWPLNPPKEFILVVPDMHVDGFSETTVRDAIRGAGYTLVERHHGTITDWTEYHVYSEH